MRASRACTSVVEDEALDLRFWSSDSICSRADSVDVRSNVKHGRTDTHLVERASSALLRLPSELYLQLPLSSFGGFRCCELCSPAPGRSGAFPISTHRSREPLLQSAQVGTGPARRWVLRGVFVGLTRAQSRTRQGSQRRLRPQPWREVESRSDSCLLHSLMHRCSRECDKGAS
ncbi:hypothetical protein M011DRAFT_164104 [Sporormia fimetaria CBS 119925]|uniref:Uncharacterized protein n=1 Tax=Sporormia fimetaria CBS 119925 TaxID=1340428 RepID=A0A6A6V288_9PLEO|nr:hypothetical protein M011DRAFT_164104 [Sporormia fimetaria CBS 119925]